MLHNTIPHFHYSSQEHNAKEIATHDSHHQHEHSHDHEQESNSNWFDISLGVLSDLYHSDLGEGHFENIITQSESSNLDYSSNDVVKAVVALTVLTHWLINRSEKVNFVDRPPILPERHQYGSDPLRGPPSIS